MEKEEILQIVKVCMEACLERYTVPAMLSVEETAEKLGISKDTVRDYLRKGELTGYEIGNRMMRVSVESINKLLDCVTTRPADAEEQKPEEPKPEEQKPEEQKPEEPKPEEPKPEEFERCTAVHPKNGKQCVLPAGHEGKHHCE